MKDNIRLLTERVYNQIAAGEVVHRPASVVKEMMENAIDAGATEVIVNVRDNGRELVQIVDNGSGMTPYDARMAFERHATSKISEAEDIYALRTFGFRGEALASICAVSQVELRTRRHGANIGTVTKINGGRFVEQLPFMCEAGSQFFVRNLFYNTPARRAFAEKESVRSSHIKDEFRRVALCNKDIAFELYADDAPIFRVAASSLAGRIVDIMGQSFKKNLLEVSANTQIVKVSGYIGTPKISKKGTSNQFLFVNGRYFRSPYLNKAIAKGFEKLIPPEHNPAFFLFLEVEPNRIDVNVHPQKTEVKFADDTSVWQILNAAVRESLARTGVVPMMEFNNESNIEIPVLRQGGLMGYNEPRATDNPQYNPFDPDYISTKGAKPQFDDIDTEYVEARGEVVAGEYLAERPAERYEVEYEDIEATSSTSPDIITYPSAPDIETTEWSEVEVTRDEEDAQQGDLLANYSDKVAEVGDVAMTSGRYAWCCIDRKMTVIDLRRAKERLLYDYYISTFSGGERISQTILFPIDLTLSIEEYALMEENAEEFSMLGFDIAYGGAGEISINGLPADVTAESVDTLIYELLQIVKTPQNIAEELRSRLAMVMARNSSQNIGRNLSSQAAKEIVDQLFRGGNTRFSPSGKAIMWSVGNEEIRERLG